MRWRTGGCLSSSQRYKPELFLKKETARERRPPLVVRRGRKSRGVIAHPCVFMPNQAQQRAAPPRAIDWRKAGEAQRGNERRGGRFGCD